MKELLERWAAAEPERCHRNGAIFRIQKGENYAGFCHFYVGTIDGPEDSDFEDIQVAVRQAIEARGWKWGRSPIGEAYQIVIPKEGFSTEYWEWIESHETLLGAYLEAIEKTRP